ncbi:undecaprenyl-phosphate glucose phosphotransferase [Bradyrhizobium erythrophlei]|uniref:Undecaprenyl-phosphate galactose phosphotransferase/putative colanic acid biosysnthesis UDP-glucose lipid carrier transferase n=1 Tax=Bradyrhizobium erythrophlei TaxID=1437360 RepID=A0A1M5PD91_9BRAD|nr:undecaprenyl-phosphate glucose phosphotransferase [Bradyrhizobium erythrophlei]SHG99746.1 undecaprenyl-phosphate galactose phosphotransferase/putative colanic acid biosysnthesis UDP-glucose lipid carrier transferase [Bradyrhizobium erythrophlei]
MSIGSDIRDELHQLGDSSRQPPASFSSDAISPLLATVDALVILLSSLAGGIGYQWLVGYPISSILPYCAVGLLASFIHILRMNRSGYYDFPDCAKPRVEVVEVLVCWLTTGLLLAFLAFLLKVGLDYSRGAFVLFYFIAPIGLLGVRKFTKTALAAAVSHGAIGRRDAVLIGEFNELAGLGPQSLLALFGSAEVNRFVLSREDDASARTAADARIIDSVANFVRRHDCREILLALSWGDECRLEFIRDRVKTLPVAVRLLPDIRVRSLTNLSSSARPRVLAIEIQRAPLGGTQRFVKRMIDIALASLAFIFFLPIMTLTAIAIKLDSPGPVIFRQNRKGFNGKQFVIFKFRTMAVQENGPAVVQATRNDARVTTIGRLLRSASIDELPQLLNVLKGDMSLIGPRPHALAHDNYFESVLSDYAFRHHVKPGITGWAQCNGARGATPSIEHISERVKLDLWYINNWSLWLDIHILIKTCFEVLRKRNAY